MVAKQVIRIGLSLGVTLIVALMAPSPAAPEPGSQSGEALAKVRDLVAGYTDAWNRHDLGPCGVWLSGDDRFASVLGEWEHPRGGAESADPRLRTRLLGVSAVAEGAAVANVVWELSPVPGSNQPPRQGVLSHLLVKSGGSWTLADTRRLESPAWTSALDGRAGK